MMYVLGLEKNHVSVVVLEDCGYDVVSSKGNVFLRHIIMGHVKQMGACVVTEPSSFQEVVEQPVWVDVMVEDYDSIVRNSVLYVVPRSEDKLVVRSH